MDKHDNMSSGESKNELKTLIERYLNGHATPQESAFVEQYYSFFEQQDNYTDSLTETQKAALKRQMLSKIQASIKEAETVPVRKIGLLKRLLPAAAAVVAFLLIGSYLWYRHAGEDKAVDKNQAVVAPLHNDVPAGVDGAVLTLASGRQIVIDSTQNGELTKDNQRDITKIGGVLVVKSSAGANATATSYNTLTTPRARQFQVVLPDGTKVWINASSSIRFPDAFTDTKREVEMTGEAYFEVAHDAIRPFIVKVNNSAIQVLGTHFNVMAYDNENAVRTTLLEGAVNFSSGKDLVRMVPGQQCQLFRDGKLKLESDVDVEYATAWKNGRQIFKSADLPTIMRQVERWYDLDVVFDGSVSKATYSGNIPRTASLSQILKMLQLSDVHFTLDEQNKKLIIKP